ncbi:hypothetical protein FKM82_020539 [Ascaphus truei]
MVEHLWDTAMDEPEVRCACEGAESMNQSKSVSSLWVTRELKYHSDQGTIPPFRPALEDFPPPTLQDRQERLSGSLQYEWRLRVFFFFLQSCCPLVGFVLIWWLREERERERESAFSSA